jgi:hypothetical protein
MEAGIIISTGNPIYTAGKYTDNALVNMTDVVNFCYEYGQLGK